MNSYNQNLITAINSEIAKLENEQKKILAQKNAAQFTLYFAEGSVLTAKDKLNQVKTDYKSAKVITSEAVYSNNLAANLDSTTKITEQNVDSTITNAATAAANVQTASKVISKLASDIGSVFNIVSAADYGTDIYSLCKQANNLIGTTAYNAELASQHAMEASSLTSEITAKTVSEKSSATKTKVEELLSVVKTKFDNIAVKRENANKKLATSQKAEKIAEGTLEDSDIQYNAVKSAYETTNKELNFNLLISNMSSTGFSVNFDSYEVPFKTAEGKPISEQPIENYYVIIAKSSLKNQFTTAKADSLLDNKLIAKPIAPNNDLTSYSIDFNLNDQDSNGEQLDLGQEYVAFLYIEYSQSYKKLVNNFSDLLSVGSEAFTMTQKMPEATNIIIDNKFTKVTFEAENIQGDVATQFRCILLQVDSSDHFLTLDELVDTETDIFVEDIQKTISKNNAEIKNLNEKLEKLKNSLEQNQKNQEAKDINKNRLDSLIKYQKSIEEQVKETKQSIDIKNKENDNLNKQLEANSKTIKRETKLPQKGALSSGLYFNKDIAQQVSSGNYTLASKTTGNSYEAKIDDTTTDNYGNIIENTNKYIPVVLAVPQSAGTDMDKYDSTLSFPDPVSVKNKQ